MVGVSVLLFYLKQHSSILINVCVNPILKCVRPSVSLWPPGGHISILFLSHGFLGDYKEQMAAVKTQLVGKNILILSSIPCAFFIYRVLSEIQVYSVRHRRVSV